MATSWEEVSFWRGFLIGDNCWLWQGARHRQGYGEVWFRGRKWKTHRLAYFLWTGVVPEEDVLHACDVRLCGRPDHLHPGDQTLNNEEMRARGRLVPPPRMPGERNHRAKLTDAQVREIQALVAGGAQRKAVARRYGVSPPTITRLCPRIAHS